MGRFQNKSRGEAALRAAGLDGALDLYRNPATNGEYEERTIRDIVSKTLNFGRISDAQAAFVHKLFQQIEDRPARAAERQAEHDSAADCPSGHIKVEGTVVSVKIKTSDRYGDSLKMTVKHDDGWLVWGSVPACLGGVADFQEKDGRCVKRGDRIRFSANVEPSDGDPKFGFFKRPSEACVVLDSNLTKAMDDAVFGLLRPEGT